MANYANLKSDIAGVIRTNNNEEITGDILQEQLLGMVDSLGAGFQYKGVETPTTAPGTPDENVFYIASTAGTYTNFGGLVVAEGEVAILKYNGSWAKEVTGAATAAQVTQLGQEVGDLADLQTTDKSSIVAAINEAAQTGGGGSNLTGYVSVASIADLPDPGEDTLGYLIGENLYLYVGTGGDTLDGKYQDCGPFRGPAGQNGTPGTTGQNGKSAYQIWLEAGNVGTEDDFLASLQGAPGPQGEQGEQGEQGPQGVPGPQGNTGSSIDYPFTLINNLTEGGTDKGLTAEQGKIIGTELFNYDFGETGTYQCWVEKLYSLLSRAGVDSDNNEYGYTFQIPASGTITITRPTVVRWRVYFYTKLGDTAGTSESAWITTDSSQFTMPTGTSAIRIIFQYASNYLNADYLDYAFTISGAVPYGGAYRKIVEVHADRVAGAKAEIVNDVLFAEKSEQIITTMDVGYYTTNGYNKVASASRLLAYRIPVRTPFLISCDSNYLMNFYYGKTQDRASRQNDSTWVSYFYVQIDEPGWVSIIVRRSDNASVTSQDILDCKLTITQQPGYITNQETFGDAGLISYGGSRPALSNQAKVWRGYNPGNIPLNQDGSAYGDYLFSINNGVFYSYKISTRTRINNGTSLGRTFHANTVMFGSEVASGSNFPLLYVSDTKNHKLAVYKVTGDETAFALEYQYDIDCTTIDTSLIGKGDSSFFVDAENGFLYLFRYKETGYPTTPVMTNGVYITRFNLPQSGTVLTSSDILDTVYLNNFDYAAIQGGFVSHGQIYFAVGTGPYTTTAYLDVYEPLQQKVITCLNLTKMFPGEPETVTYIEEEKAILFANSGIWMRVRF